MKQQLQLLSVYNWFSEFNPGLHSFRSIFKTGRLIIVLLAEVEANSQKMEPLIIKQKHAIEVICKVTKKSYKNL